MTGDTFDGQRAAEIGLVNTSVPREDLGAAVTELTQKLLKHNPETLRSTKETFRHAARMDYEQATDYMAAKSAQLLLRDKEGADKGLTQFLDTKEIRPGSSPTDPPNRPKPRSAHRAASVG